MTVFRHGDMAFFQYQRGTIDEVRFQSALRIVTNVLPRTYVKNLWNRVKYHFVPEYRLYLDQFLSEHTIEDIAPVYRFETENPG